MDRLRITLVGSHAHLDAVRLVLLGAVATPELDGETREACARAAMQLAVELSAAEEESDDEDGDHAHKLLRWPLTRESRS